MAKAKKEAGLTPEERLQAALIPDWEWPYKLPENWCWVSFGTVCKFENGYAFKSEKFSNDIGVPVIRISSIKDNEVDVDSCVYTTENQVDDKFIVHYGDLLIAMSGATTGKNGIFLSNRKAYLNQRVGNIKVINEAALHHKYRNFYIAEKTDEILRNAYGGAQPNISSNKICEMAFPLPPLSEQQRIVDRIESLFAKLDKAKEKAQAVVDSFETRKAAILHKAFTGELTANWREEHGVGVESWESVPLSNVCTVNPKKVDTKNLPDELEVSFFPMPALSEIYGEITEPQIRPLKEVRSGFTNFSEGDVVFAKITPCMENGKSAVIGKLVNGIGFGTTEFFVLRCSDRLYNRFLYHLVRGKSFRDKAKAVMTGAVGQQRVPKSFLENYLLHLPEVDEQKEIIRILDDFFAKEQQAKEAAEAVLDQIDLMKKSILARAFRGELGTNDPTDEPAVELLKKVLDIPAEPKPKAQRKFIPKELDAQIKTDLERKIIKAFIQNETDVLSIKQLMSVSSKKFDVMEALRSLQNRGILIKENDTYKFMG